MELKALLADDGVFVLEVSYLKDVIDDVLFDTIYHEHLSYHARPLKLFFERQGIAADKCRKGKSPRRQPAGNLPVGRGASQAR